MYDVIKNKPNMTFKSKFRLNLRVNFTHVGTENYLRDVYTFVYWAHRCVEREPHSDQYVMFQYYTDITLDGLESN